MIFLALAVSAASCSKEQDAVNDPDVPDKGENGGNGSAGSFDPSDNRSDVFYDWTAAETRQVVPGVTYTRYSFVNFDQNIHVLDVDLTNPKLTVETSMADDLAPNPNANKRHNNGPNLRETLRQNITRKRSEGRNIVAGINTGFFDSHFGILRGVHIEKGEAVYINNPSVRSRLVNHAWGFAFFKDRTLGFERRTVYGNIRVADRTFPYHSVNDTIVALTEQTTYDANVYTHRFVREPHPGIYNKVGTRALFIVAKGDEVITVNTGYQRAVVTDVIDGRNVSIKAPFVTGRGEWVLQITGARADQLAGVVKAGDPIEIETVVGVGAVTAPIDVYNASMYQYVAGGRYVAPSTDSAAEKIYQTMNIGADGMRTRLCLFAIDGIEGNRGLDFYEAFRVARKLGLSDVVRVDGGGSTTMWVLDDRGGDVVNNITDSKGERSCMNYLHIRQLD